MVFVLYMWQKKNRNTEAGNQKLEIRRKTPNVFLLSAFCFLLFFATHSFAQRDMFGNEQEVKLNFGFALGINSTNFRVIHSDVFNISDSILIAQSKKGPGFNVGILTDLKLNEHWSLRFIPALSFAEKSLDYMVCIEKDMNGNCVTQKNVLKKIESIYTTLPLLLKFSSDRFGDNRVYLVGGFAYTYDWSSNAEARNDPDIVKIAQNDFTAEYGAGLDIYLPMAKMSLEVKASYGLIDILVPDDFLIYTSVLQRLNSRGILFSLYIGG